MTPDGGHCYVTSRGYDSVAGFSINMSDGGSLSPVTMTATGGPYVHTGGRTPWSVTCASNSLVLVTNQYGDDPAAREGGGKDADPERVYGQGKEPGSLVVFKRNPATGELTPGAKWEAPHVLHVQCTFAY